MSDKLNDDTPVSILLQRFESSNELRDGIAYYHRCHEGHVGKSYAFLKQCMDRCLARAQQKKHREEQTAGFSRTLNSEFKSNIALPADLTRTHSVGKGRGAEGRGRGRGAARSAKPSGKGRRG